MPQLHIGRTQSQCSSLIVCAAVGGMTGSVKRLLFTACEECTKGLKISPEKNCKTESKILFVVLFIVYLGHKVVGNY